MPCKSKMTMSKISELSSHTYMDVFNHMDTKYVDWNIWTTFCQFGDEVNRLCIKERKVKCLILLCLGYFPLSYQ